MATDITNIHYDAFILLYQPKGIRLKPLIDTLLLNQI